MQVACISNGELKWQSSYGTKNINTSNPVNDSTLFMIASCSKPVTALALLKLYDQGKIDLDDDINDYLPFKMVNPHFPDGQLRTTVGDYAQFLALILNKGKVNGKTFVKASTVDLFLEVQFPEVYKYQAIAWNYNEFENFIYYLLMPRLPSHTGADPGVATVVSFDPKNKTGAIIFSNSPTTNFKGQKIFYQEMVKKLLRVGRN